MKFPSTKISLNIILIDQQDQVKEVGNKNSFQKKAINQ